MTSYVPKKHRLVLIRPNKVHLISTGDMYKRNLSRIILHTFNLTTMGKTKELTNDVRDKIVDLHGWNGLQNHLTSRQLLVRLFVNGSNTKQLSIALGLGLHARYPLVRYRQASERCRITSELHRESL